MASPPCVCKCACCRGRIGHQMAHAQMPACVVLCGGGTRGVNGTRQSCCTIGRCAATAQATAPVIGAAAAETTRCVQELSHRWVSENVSAVAATVAGSDAAGMQHTTGSQWTL